LSEEAEGLRARAGGGRRKSGRHGLGALLICVLALAPLAKAIAQEGVDAYPAAYFAGNQPATAYEMVALLPGFHIQLGDTTVRGFSGTVGNVLIDGQLPSSKEETVDLLLRRIAASSVERIELIRGAADMHGYPVLANVVRNKSTVLRARAEVEGGITHFGTTEDKVALHLAVQGARSLIELSANWGRDIGTQNQNGYGTRMRFLPNGTPLQLSNYSFPQFTNNTGASASYRQPLWDGDLSLGVAYKQSRAYSDVSEQIYFPSASLVTGLESKLARNGEALVDYKRPLADLGQLELFVVHRLTEQDEISQTTNITGTSKSRGLFNQREDVARLAWHYSPGALKLEAGVEGSINVLSSRSTLTQAGAPVILPAANIRLEEKRAELFSTANWRFSPMLMSELGMRYETSTLSQSGDSSLNKDLTFLKPRWLTTFTPMPGQEFRLLLERQVGQLVFRNFASSTSLNGNTVNGGNKNLEPARSWNISLAWEAHFWGHGSLVLEAKREFISKVVDFIPVFSGTQVFNAVGNIGNGIRDGVSANVILPLDKLGLTGVTATGEAVWHHSRVRDPATGLFRQIVGGQTVSANQFVAELTGEMTYDIPDKNLQLGVDLHTHFNSHEADYRIDEIDPNHHGFKLGVFVEYKPTPDWTLRAFDRDIAQTAAYRDRYVYAGLRGSSPLSYIEYRQLSNGAVTGLDLQHDF
jgi:outer membrane receptor protein involved in Fe transport